MTERKKDNGCMKIHNNTSLVPEKIDRNDLELESDKIHVVYSHNLKHHQPPLMKDFIKTCTNQVSKAKKRPSITKHQYQNALNKTKPQQLR